MHAKRNSSLLEDLNIRIHANRRHIVAPVQFISAQDIASENRKVRGSPSTVSMTEIVDMPEAPNVTGTVNRSADVVP